MRCLVVLATVSCGSTDLSPPEHGQATASSTAAVPAMLSGSNDPWYVGTLPTQPTPTPTPVPVPQLPPRLSPPDVQRGNVEPPPPTLIASAHTAMISAVAVSEDGTAAVSADQRGSLRLWPSLDGTREPVIVAAPAAAQLALLQLYGAFSIAVIDHAGRLEVIGTTDDGQRRSRRSVEIARPLVEIHALATGLYIALRDDRAIVSIDRDGNVLGTLTAKPGVRVAALAVRNNRVLAILDSGSEVHGQWVEVIPGLRWGDVTPKLAITPVGRVVLSPAHNKIASTTREGRTIAIVDVTTGQRTARPLDQEFPDLSLSPLGFVDAETLAISANGRAVFWRRVMLDTADIEATVVPAVANGKLVGAATSHLTLMRPERNVQQLGYRVTHLSAIQRRTNGWLVTDGTQAIRVDDEFHELAAYELPEVDGIRYMYGMTLVDGDHVLASGSSGHAAGTYLIDHARGTADLVVDGGLVGYDPTTRVAVFRLATSYQIARFDSKRGQFGPLTTVPSDAKANAEVMLPPPGHPGLAIVVAYDPDNAHATLTTIKTIPDATGGALKLGKPRKVTLSDAFLDGTAGLESLVPPGKPQYTSPDKRRVAELDGARIRLRDSTGTELWTIAASGARGLTWTKSGELIAFGSGITKLDVATGARVERQCGWRFGLWAAQTLAFGGGDQCEAQ